MGLRVGIVGWGEIARRHAQCLRESGALVSGVVTRNEQADTDARRFETLDAMLPSVDAVTVAVPNHLHAACCLEAIHAGRAVLVEKPLLISETERRALSRALPRADAPVHVGYRLRYNSRLRRLRERHPRPRRIECTYRMGIASLAAGKPWTRESASTGGVFFTLGCHMLDLARWLARTHDQSVEELDARTDAFEAGADYPLRGAVSGRLGGVQVAAVADTRGDLPSRIDVRVESAGGAGTSSLHLDESEEPGEYLAMIHDFVVAASAGRTDPVAATDMLLLHGDLLRAREIATRNGGESPPRAPGTALR